MTTTDTGPIEGEEKVAVATTARYNSRGLVWAVAKIGPYDTKQEARAVAERMLRAHSSH